MAKKNVKLEHVGYKFDGCAVLNLWGGGQGQMEMDSWEGTSLKKSEVARGINDGQMGCESIDSALVVVYDLYENDYAEIKKTIEFTAKELKEAQRGI